MQCTDDVVTIKLIGAKDETSVAGGALRAGNKRCLFKASCTLPVFFYYRFEDHYRATSDLLVLTFRPVLPVSRIFSTFFDHDLRRFCATTRRFASRTSDSTIPRQYDDDRSPLVFRLSDFPIVIERRTITTRSRFDSDSSVG